MRELTTGAKLGRNLGSLLFWRLHKASSGYTVYIDIYLCVCVRPTSKICCRLRDVSFHGNCVFMSFTFCPYWVSNPGLHQRLRLCPLLCSSRGRLGVFPADGGCGCVCVAVLGRPPLQREQRCITQTKLSLDFSCVCLQ